ncbi:MAG: hypothetical protein IK086_02025 [Clostridia bacterium]|nr:hypothetical protein [Clostridia bacterium]
MKKRIFCIVLACMLVFCLAACGESGSGDATNTVNRSADGLWNKKFEGVTLKRILWYTPIES